MAKERQISMKALLIAIACVAAAVGGLAACGGAADSGESGAAQAQPPATPTAIAAAQALSTSPPTAQAPPTSTAVAAAQTPPTSTPTVAASTATPVATPESLRAPEFSLPSADGGTVSLSGLLDGKDGAALVFYRGFF